MASARKPSSFSSLRPRGSLGQLPGALEENGFNASLSYWPGGGVRRRRSLQRGRRLGSSLSPRPGARGHKATQAGTNTMPESQEPSAVGALHEAATTACDPQPGPEVGIVDDLNSCRATSRTPVDRDTFWCSQDSGGSWAVVSGIAKQSVPCHRRDDSVGRLPSRLLPCRRCTGWLRVDPRRSDSMATSSSFISRASPVNCGG